MLGMAQAGNNGFQISTAGILAQCADNAGPHKSGGCPCAKANKVGAPLHGMQAVMADFQTQQGKVLANAVQPLQAHRTARRQHDGVVHVAAIVGYL